MHLTEEPEKGTPAGRKNDKSISEIAYEVGFTAPSYFNKCFKDEFGTSPGALREQGSKL